MANILAYVSLGKTQTLISYKEQFRLYVEEYKVNFTLKHKKRCFKSETNYLRNKLCWIHSVILSVVLHTLVFI